MQRSQALNAFSVDVEEWFHLISEACPAVELWDSLPQRLPTVVPALLKIFSEAEVQATFFVLGWVSRKYPELVCEILDGGHEIACHGDTHRPIGELSEVEFYEDLLHARESIESACGVVPLGYRAPGFSVTKSTPWALDIIKEAGFFYDSSLLMCRHPHGGRTIQQAGPTILDNGLVELPVTTTRFWGKSVPFGGGYLRIMNKSAAMLRAQRASNSGESLIFYMHPRDIDPGQPKMSLGPVRKLKTYARLENLRKTLPDLLTKFDFTTMSNLALTTKNDS